MRKTPLSRFLKGRSLHAFLLGAALCLSSVVSAQTGGGGPHVNEVPDSIQRKGIIPCGGTSEFFQSLKAANGTNPPVASSFITLSNFPATAIKHCGKFDLYYEDLALSSAGGFNDATWGVIRQNTFCAVLQKLESTFNFNSIPASAPIRVYVELSYSTANPAPAGTGFYAQAGPLFTTPGTGLKTGDINQYTVTGVDPNPTGYHAMVRVNFHQVTSQNVTTAVSYYNNSTGTVANMNNCDLDLYTTLLHEMGHALGFVSLVQFSGNVPALVNGNYTGIDNSIYVGPINSLSKLINSGSINSTLTASNNYWINNSAAPNNHPVYSGTYNVFANPGSYVSHLDDQVMAYGARQRISPGDLQEYVMGPFGIKGVMMRDYTEGEVRIFMNALGYQLNPTYATTNAVTLNNTVPYSTKMGNYAYPFQSTSNFPECVPQDFAMTNNIGATLTFNLSSDNTLVDADGDPIYIYPGSIVNLRGCGNSQSPVSNGNNHVQLQEIYDANGNITGLTYTPRPNFFGRAQFGITLWDGKEKGSFVLYTINVSKGTNCNFPPGSDLVLNGNFEEGTEIMRQGTEENIIYSTLQHKIHEGKFFFGAHFSDGHPFCTYTNSWQPWGGGTLINKANITCAAAAFIKHEAGSPTNSFPEPAPFTNGVYPNAAPNGGKRYQNLMPYVGAFYSLGEKLTHCRRYTLRFQAYAPVPISNIPIVFGFTDVASIGCNINFSNFFNPPLNATIDPTKVNPGSPGTLSFSSNWTGYSIDFYYCGTNPSDVLFIHPAGGIGNWNQQILIDNITLQENLSPLPPVTITQANVINTPACTDVQLGITGLLAGCGPNTYSWSSPTPGVTFSCTTCANPIVNTTIPADIFLTVSNGCQSTTQKTKVYTTESWFPVITTPNFCALPTTLTVQPNDPNLTYVWTGPQNGNGNPFSVSQPGTYNLTVTTPSGCVKTNSIAVGSGNAGCCNAAIENNSTTRFFSSASSSNNGFASAMINAFPPGVVSVIGGTINVNNYTGHILINGTFVIDQNLTFNNCPNVVFHPNAWVTVNNGRTLTLNTGTQLRAACNKMWLGIESSGSGAIVVNGATLKDMQNGIKIVGSAPLTVNNAQFINNYYGIWVLYKPVANTVTVQSSTFTCNGSNLLFPYTGQLARAGIRVDDSRQIQIGSMNSTSLGNNFTNLKTGIYIDMQFAPPAGSGSANFYLYNNTFSSLTGSQYGMPIQGGGTVGLYNDPTGTAIFAFRKPTYSIPAKLWVQNGNVAANVYQAVSCDKGIIASSFSADVQKFKVNNSWWAQSYGNINACSYNVTNNAAINTYYGYEFNSGVPASGYVFNNTFNSKNLYNYIFNGSVILPYPIGIGFTPYTASSYSFKILYNGLTVNSFAGIGINVLNGNTGTLLEDNNITLTTNTSQTSTLPLHGISVASSLGSMLKDNRVTGTVACRNANRTNVSGIYLRRSQRMVLECNDMAMVRYGFITESNCATFNVNNVRGNTFKDHVYGMLFRWNGTEGTLGDIGSSTLNKNNTFTFSSLTYAYAGGFRLFQLSTCPSSLNHRFYSTVINNSHSGGPASCRYTVWGTTNTLYICPPDAVLLTEDEINKVADIGLAEQIARDQVVYPSYPVVNNWMAARRLYDELYHDQPARDTSVVLDSFFLESQNATMGQIHDVDQYLRGANDTIIAQDSLLYEDWLDGLKDRVNSVTGLEEYVWNERNIDNINTRFMRHGIDGLSMDERQFIYDLSMQCPYIGGLGVYKARSLYGLFYPQVSFDDIGLCNNGDGKKGGKGMFDEENELLMSTVTEASPNIKLYPNPASEYVTIEYNEAGKLEVFDMMGRLFSTSELKGAPGLMRLDMKNATPGIYNYRYIVDGKPNETGKLVIVQ